jgi:hypothetical protein
VSNTPIIYVDGVSQALTQTSVGVTYTTDDATVNFGQAVGSTQDWDGEIAECGFYNRILTADGAASLAAGYTPEFLPNGLIAYWDMNSNIERIVGAVLTPTGNATITAHPPKVIPFIRTRGVFVPAAGGSIYTRTGDDFMFVPDDRRSIMSFLRGDTSFLLDQRRSVTELRASDSLLMNDQTRREIYLRALDLLFLLDEATASSFGVTVVTVADTLLLLDAVRREILLTRPDQILLPDEARSQAIRQRAELDTLLLNDQRLSKLELRAFDALYVADRTVREIYLRAIDLLFLLDAANAQFVPAGSTIYTRTVEDAVFLLDELVRLTQKVSGEQILMFDSAGARAIRNVVGSDRFMFSDVTTRLMEKIATDPLLIVDYAVRQILLRIVDNPVLFLDTALASFIQISAQALVYARLAIANVIPSAVGVVGNFMGVADGRDRLNYLRSETGIIRSQDA